MFNVRRYLYIEEQYFHFKMLLPPFHNVSHSSISHIHIDVNEFRHISI